MAPIPAPSPTGITGYSAPNQNAGGGQPFVASGPCSGTVLVHTQDLMISYEITTMAQGGGTWLPTSTDVSALKLYVVGCADDSLSFFSTSSVSGAQCAGAADARQAHVLTLSSTTATAAMGTAGSIYTLSGGYERRWTRTGDAAEEQRFYGGNILFPIVGLPENWNYDSTLSNNIARQIVAQVVAGGLEYSADGTLANKTVMPQWDLMDFSLMDI